jgi:hypothetical protein
MNSDPAKLAWQNSVDIAGAPPLEDVRRNANKFYRWIKWRNRIEYVSCAIAIVVFGRVMIIGPHILHHIGGALLVAAAIYAPWQLHRRASAVQPAMDGGVPIYVFQRGQLVRQRDALRTILVWYILPFFPGIILIFAGNGADPAIEAAGPPIWQRWLAIAVILSLFAFIWWVNQLAARRLQRKIDEIDALTGKTG